MLISTRGIALSTVKFSDNKFIAKIYTEHFGLQSYIVYESSKKRNSRMFSHLTIIDIVVLNKNNRDLQLIKEVSLNYIPESIPFDIRKCSLAMFLIDIINACIKEHEPNQNLFNFLFNTVVNLDKTLNGLSYFHLQFMANFSEYLGCKPENNYSENNCYFNLDEGHFSYKQPNNQYFLDAQQSFIIYNLLNTNNNFDFKKHITAELRDKILISLLEYYKLHLPGMGKLNSINILKELMA